jgi:hypothetical protein
MRRRVLFGLLLVLFLIGCAQLTGMQSPLSEEKQFIMAAKSFYISQYNDYVSMTENPAVLTEEQKQILREKKKVLVQVKPLIDTYSAMVDAGQAPSLEQEQQIMNLLNKLGGQFK